MQQLQFCFRATRFTRLETHYAPTPFSSSGCQWWTTPRQGTHNAEETELSAPCKHVTHCEVMHMCSSASDLIIQYLMAINTTCPLIIQYSGRSLQNCSCMLVVIQQHDSRQILQSPWLVCCIDNLSYIPLSALGVDCYQRIHG